MRRVRTPGAKHQSSVPPATADATVDEQSVTLALIHALIHALNPLGLRAVEEALQHEVVALAGARYARGGGQPGLARWGAQPGSVYLADQKVPVTAPCKSTPS